MTVEPKHTARHRRAEATRCSGMCTGARFPVAMPADPSISDLRRRVGLFVLVLLTITVGGTFGYVRIEDWTAMEALYMTVITLSTVGFKEVQPLSTGGQLWTMGLIVAGVGAVGYLFKSVG